MRGKNPNILYKKNASRKQASLTKISPPRSYDDKEELYIMEKKGYYKLGWIDSPYTLHVDKADPDNYSLGWVYHHKVKNKYLKREAQILYLKKEDIRHYHSTWEDIPEKMQRAIKKIAKRRKQNSGTNDRPLSFS